MNDRLELLAWDTQFFGFRIGRLNAARLSRDELNTVLQEADAGGFRCLYYTVDPDDYKTIDAVGSAGFALVDIRVLLEYPFDNRPAPSPRYPVSSQITVRDSCRDDWEALESIAIATGHSSRFSFDPVFPRDACPRLYCAWLRKLLDDPCSRILVVCFEGRPIGLIGCSRSDDITGTIELAGVDPGMRGKGAGTALVQTALEWFRAQELTRAEVVTQGRNVPAQRLYQQMGFFTRHITLYYHRWLPVA